MRLIFCLSIRFALIRQEVCWLWLMFRPWSLRFTWVMMLSWVDDWVVVRIVHVSQAMVDCIVQLVIHINILILLIQFSIVLVLIFFKLLLFNLICLHILGCFYIFIQLTFKFSLLGPIWRFVDGLTNQSRETTLRHCCCPICHRLIGLGHLLVSLICFSLFLSKSG